MEVGIFDSQRNLIVDEVEKLQRDRYICFIAQIFQLSYAVLCQEPIDKEKSLAMCWM